MTKVDGGGDGEGRLAAVNAEAKGGGWRERAKAEAEASRRVPVQVAASAAPQEFHRERVATADSAADLTEEQKALEEKLRLWRKTESERMGLPQFFVLGTTALRAVVLERPKTLKQLQGIQGIGLEKAEKFGASILEVCNG